MVDIFYSDNVNSMPSYMDEKSCRNQQKPNKIVAQVIDKYSLTLTVKRINRT